MDGSGQVTTIYTALARAQAEMGRALKDSTNPAFRSKYADLSSVMDACLPALNKHGIAVIQPTADDESGRFVETVLLHESGESLRCRVPLIVQKNDMQGYGSAVTYARRYGLMCMAGIAPEDDDGNAAAKAAPRRDGVVDRGTITADQFLALRGLLEQSGGDESRFLAFFRIDMLDNLPAARFAEAEAMLRAKIAKAGA